MKPLLILALSLCAVLSCLLWREHRLHVRYKSVVSWYSGAVDYLNHGTDNPYEKRIPVVLKEITSYRTQAVEFIKNGGSL